MAQPLNVIESNDKSQIIVSGYGCFLCKKSQRLQVKQGGKVIFQTPLFRLNEVAVTNRAISISAALIDALCARGTRIVFASDSGKPYALISSPVLNAVIENRRSQFKSLDDERGANLGKTIIQGKIRNQINLLQQIDKNHNASTARTAITTLSNYADKVGKLSVNSSGINPIRNRLMGFEGSSSRIYWMALAKVLSGNVHFKDRKTRGATDPFNVLLNYGYGILYGCAWGAILNAGLEPFAGFVHVDRAGKPSLVLDFVEEFRQPIVDWQAISFVEQLDAPIEKIDSDILKVFAKQVLNRLETHETFDGKSYQLKSIIQIQARNIASYLRGLSKSYEPYEFRIK